MKGLGIIAVLIISFVTFLVNPIVALSPKQENTERLVVYGGNTLLPIAYQGVKTDLLSSFYGNSDYYPLLTEYDGWCPDLMYKIMGCESSFNERAVGDRGTYYWSYGLLQIRNLPNRNYTVEELFDPARNIEIAYEIFKKQGYWAWANCYRRVR